MKGRGLLRTGLRDTNNIMTLEHGWNSVFLDRGWKIVTHQLYVFEHDRMKASISKMADGLDSCWTFLLDLDLVDPICVSLFSELK